MEKSRTIEKGNVLYKEKKGKSENDVNECEHGVFSF